MPTNTPKSLLAAALFLTPALSQAQTNLIWWDYKEWRQIGPSANLYLGGWTDVFFEDGSWALSGCGHPSFSIIPPNIFCPLGTTAFIAQGDIDGDGLNDQGSFWSVSAVTPAVLVEPFRTDLFRIYAAPPSGITDILNSSGGDTHEIFDVQDTSVVIWYNVLTGTVDDFEVTQFEAHRHYGPGRGELSRHYKDIPWGVYTFSLPGLVPNNLNVTPQDRFFKVNHLVTPDAYPGRGALPQGWQMINEEWIDGKLQFDPRQFYDFRWFGLSPQNTLLTDSLLFSMRGNQYLDTTNVPRTRKPPEFLVTGNVTGLSCNTVVTNINLDRALEQGKMYQMTITSGNLTNTTEYPITVFGTGAGLAANELLTVTDLSGGIVTGGIQAVAGTTLTTNRDLASCLTAGQAYRLTITGGALTGTEEFPITAWGAPGAMDMTTVNPLALASGDTFTLTPEAVPTLHQVQTVAGYYIEGNMDLSTLVPGGDYRISIATGALAGTEVRIRNSGFPTPFFFETETDISGSLMVGDQYAINLVGLPTNFLEVGDTISFSQTFEDWIQDLYDAGDVLAVDELTLSDPFVGFGIPAIPELLVDVGLYAVAREDVINFPPYPIQTPVGDRTQFLLGTFDGHYELGPFFFRPGDSLNGRLAHSRAAPAGSFTTDRVNRILNFETQFIDTYDGFALTNGLAAGAGFPFNVSATERAAEFDFDRDGATNLMEYALGTNVGDPLDKPQFQYALDEGLGLCTASLTKRPFTSTSVNYFFEYSTDLVNWTTIRAGDAIFDIVQDDETTLTVSNIQAVVGGFPPPSCFLRVRVSLN